MSAVVSEQKRVPERKPERSFKPTARHSVEDWGWVYASRYADNRRCLAQKANTCRDLRAWAAKNEILAVATKRGPK